MSCPRTKSVEAGSQGSAVSSNVISEARRIESGPGLRVSPRISLPVSCRRACVSLTILVQISSSTKHHSKQYWCGPRCWCDGRGAMFLRRTMWLTTHRAIPLQTSGAAQRLWRNSKASSSQTFRGNGVGKRRRARIHEHDAGIVFKCLLLSLLLPDVAFRRTCIDNDTPLAHGKDFSDRQRDRQNNQTLLRQKFGWYGSIHLARTGSPVVPQRTVLLHRHKD